MIVPYEGLGNIAFLGFQLPAIVKAPFLDDAEDILFRRSNHPMTVNGLLTRANKAHINNGDITTERKKCNMSSEPRHLSFRFIILS